MEDSKLSQNRGMDAKKQAHIVNHVKDIPTLLNEDHLHINSITDGCIRYWCWECFNNMSIVTRKLEGVNHFHRYLCRQLKDGEMEITMGDFVAGDKIKLKTGENAVFEEYCTTNKNKCFVIIEPDYECKGSQVVKISEIEKI